MRKRLLVAGVSLALLSGCAGVSPMQIGQTAGTLLGAATLPGVGAPVGALLGTLVGTVFQRQADQVTAKRERKDLTERLGDTASEDAHSQGALGPGGGPIRVWVDERVRDGKVLAGHFDMYGVAPQ